MPEEPSLSETGHGDHAFTLANMASVSELTNPVRLAGVRNRGAFTTLWKGTAAPYALTPRPSSALTYLLHRERPLQQTRAPRPAAGSGVHCMLPRATLQRGAGRLRDFLEQGRFLVARKFMTPTGCHLESVLPFCCYLVKN